MSNGDDVLDNWEEIDEDGLTDKLQKLQAERITQQQQQQQQYNSVHFTSTDINFDVATSFSPTSATNSDSKAMKLLQRTPASDEPVLRNTSSSTAANVMQSPLDNMAATFQPVMMVLHQPTDEYQGANYTQPVNTQTVKILRRPTQSSEPRNNGMRQRQPIKTLEQREQEYAEARLRILGAAKNPEDDMSALKAISALICSNEPSPSPTIPTQQPPVNVSTTAKANNSTSKSQSSGQTAYNNHYLHHNQQQQHQQQQQQQQQLQQQQFQQQLQQQQQHQHYYFQPQIPAYNNRTLAMAPVSQQQSQPQQTWSPIVGGSVSHNLPSSAALRQQQQQQEAVLRMPRGPDGSTGFQMRR